MKNLMIALLLALVLAVPSLGSNQVVSYEVQMATAVNVNDYNAPVAAEHYNDVVSSCHAGQVKVNAYAVSDTQYSNASYNQVVKVVGQKQVSTKQVQVVVRRGAFRLFALNGFNETVVNCVQVTRRNGVVVNRVVARRLRVRGFVVGANARRVRVAVAACR